MIRLVCENPLKYEDENGNEVEVLSHNCSLHGYEIKYCVDNEVKIPVFIPAEENECEVWREEL